MSENYYPENYYGNYEDDKYYQYDTEDTNKGNEIYQENDTSETKEEDKSTNDESTSFNVLYTEKNDIDDQLLENYNKIKDQIKIWKEKGDNLNSFISEFNNTYVELFRMNHIHLKPYPLNNYDITLKGKDEGGDMNIYDPDVPPGARTGIFTHIRQKVDRQQLKILFGPENTAIGEINKRALNFQELSNLELNKKLIDNRPFMDTIDDDEDLTKNKRVISIKIAFLEFCANEGENLLTDSLQSDLIGGRLTEEEKKVLKRSFEDLELKDEYFNLNSEDEDDIENAFIAYNGKLLERNIRELGFQNNKIEGIIQFYDENKLDDMMNSIYNELDRLIIEHQESSTIKCEFNHGDETEHAVDSICNKENNFDILKEGKWIKMPEHERVKIFIENFTGTLKKLGGTLKEESLKDSAYLGYKSVKHFFGDINIKKLLVDKSMVKKIAAVVAASSLLSGTPMVLFTLFASLGIAKDLYSNGKEELQRSIKKISSRYGEAEAYFKAGKECYRYECVKHNLISGDMYEVGHDQGAEGGPFSFSLPVNTIFRKPIFIVDYSNHLNKVELGLTMPPTKQLLSKIKNHLHVQYQHDTWNNFLKSIDPSNNELENKMLKTKSLIKMRGGGDERTDPLDQDHEEKIAGILFAIKELLEKGDKSQAGVGGPSFNKTGTTSAKAWPSTEFEENYKCVLKAPIRENPTHNSPITGYVENEAIVKPSGAIINPDENLTYIHLQNGWASLFVFSGVRGKRKVRRIQFEPVNSLKSERARAANLMPVAPEKRYECVSSRARIREGPPDFPPIEPKVFFKKGDVLDAQSAIVRAATESKPEQMFIEFEKGWASEVAKSRYQFIPVDEEGRRIDPADPAGAGQAPAPAPADEPAVEDGADVGDGADVDPAGVDPDAGDEETESLGENEDGEDLVTGTLGTTGRNIGDGHDEGVGMEERVSQNLEEIKEEINYSIEYRLLSLQKNKEDFFKELSLWKLCQFDDKQIINEFKKIKANVKKDPKNKYKNIQTDYIKDIEEKFDGNELYFHQSDLKFLRSINDNVELNITIKDKNYNIRDGRFNQDEKIEELYDMIRDKENKIRKSDLPIYFLKEVQSINGNELDQSALFQGLGSQFPKVKELYTRNTGTGKINYSLDLNKLHDTINSSTGKFKSLINDISLKAISDQSEQKKKSKIGFLMKNSPDIHNIFTTIDNGLCAEIFKGNGQTYSINGVPYEEGQNELYVQFDDLISEPAANIKWISGYFEGVNFESLSGSNISSNALTEYYFFTDECLLYIKYSGEDIYLKSNNKDDWWEHVSNGDKKYYLCVVVTDKLVPGFIYLDSQDSSGNYNFYGFDDDVRLPDIGDWDSGKWEEIINDNNKIAVGMSKIAPIFKNNGHTRAAEIVVNETYEEGSKSLIFETTDGKTVTIDAEAGIQSGKHQLDAKPVSDCWVQYIYINLKDIDSDYIISEKRDNPIYNVVGDSDIDGENIKGFIKNLNESNDDDNKYVYIESITDSNKGYIKYNKLKQANSKNEYQIRLNKSIDNYQQKYKKKYKSVVNFYDFKEYIYDLNEKYKQKIRNYKEPKKEKSEENIDRPDFNNISYLNLFQKVCGEKATLMFYGDAVKSDGKKHFSPSEKNISAKFVMINSNDSKLIITPWDSINLKPENKIWNIYRSEILPFYSLTQDTYNPTSTNLNYTIKRVKKDNDIFTDSTILDENETNSWIAPINNSNMRIDAPLIKLIFLKSTILELAETFYEIADKIEKNLKMYRKIQKLKNKTEGEDKGEEKEDSDIKSLDSETKDSETKDDVSSSLNNLFENIDSDGLSKDEPETKQTGVDLSEPIQENKLYTSGDLDKYKSDLEKLKLQILEKEMAISNMNNNIDRLEKLGHGYESEERQNQIKDYEYEQKKLIYLNDLLKQRRKKLELVSQLVQDIEEKRKREEIEKERNMTLDRELNELELMRRMKGSVKKKNERDSSLYQSLKESELSSMETKIRDLENKERTLEIESIRKREDTNELSNLLSKNKRTPRKNRKNNKKKRTQKK